MKWCYIWRGEMCRTDRYICMDQYYMWKHYYQISLAVFSIRFTLKLTNLQFFSHWWLIYSLLVLRYLLCESAVVVMVVNTVLCLLFRRANRPHFLPWLSNTEPQTHQEQPFVLQCHVMQSRSCSWQVPGLHCIRLCLVELPFLATFVWRENCKPGGRSQKVLESRSLFSAKIPAWKSMTHPSHNNRMDQ